MINRDMIKILKSKKYDKVQYDKLFDFFYHMALSKYDKKKTYELGARVSAEA